MKQEKRDLRKYSKHLRSMEAGETDYGSMGAGKGTDDDNGPRRRNTVGMILLSIPFIRQHGLVRAWLSTRSPYPSTLSMDVPAA
jgi:hypothetical protein